jgi:hypothetical protein
MNLSNLDLGKVKCNDCNEMFDYKHALQHYESEAHIQAVWNNHPEDYRNYLKKTYSGSSRQANGGKHRA